MQEEHALVNPRAYAGTREFHKNKESSGFSVEQARRLHRGDAEDAE